MSDFGAFSEDEAFEKAAHKTSIDSALTNSDDTSELTPIDPHHEFTVERYCWDGIDYKEFGVIPLTRGYFTIVSPEKYDEVAGQKWTANVQRCRETGRIVKIYAVRKHTAREKRQGVPGYVYLHRMLTNTVRLGRRVIVDHLNGHSLDCRQDNLFCTNHGHNIANIADDRVTQKTKHKGMPRGVEPIQRKWDTVYRATVYVGGRRIRSKTKFTCPERAGRWFQRMNTALHPNASLVNTNSSAPPQIIFPPLAKVCDDVPF